MVDPASRVESNRMVLKSRILRQPIDTYTSSFVRKALNEYTRLTNSEVLMSKDVFVALGLSQPAWITIEAESKYMHLAMAFMMPSGYEDDMDVADDDKRDTIVLSSMLESCYSPQSYLTIKPYKGRIECQDSEEAKNCTDIYNWQSGLMPRVTSIEFELLHHTGRQEQPTSELIGSALRECPQIVQIGDCVPVHCGQKKERDLVYLRVVSLKYRRDVKYMQKVLDITDPEIAQKVLPGEIEVSELSFNSSPGYLVHKDHLQHVTLLEQDGDKLVCPPQSLPRYTLTNYSELTTL